MRTAEELESEKAGEHVAQLEAEEAPVPPYHSGIWLFTDRENITHFFAPNFLPPYNTAEKRKIIMDVLKEEWDEKTLSWKPCGEGSMTKKPLKKEKDCFVEEKKDEDAALQLVDNERKTKSPTDESASGEENDGQINPFVQRFDDIVNEVLSQANVCCASFNTKGDYASMQPKAIEAESK